MRKLILLAAFFFVASLNAQYFVIGELTSDDQSKTLGFMDMWMSGTKEVVGKNLNMSLFQKEESNTHFFVRSFNDLQEWIDDDKASDEIGPQVFQKVSQNENVQEIFEGFQGATDFKGARLYELMSEYSNMDGYYALSDEEKLEYQYRRVVLYDLVNAGEEAFLANQKFWKDEDEKLGVDHFYALLKPVFSTDSDFMLVLLDKSRFDYHKNWSNRMDTRFSSEEFKSNYDKVQKEPVSTVVDEWNLTLLTDYIY